MLTANALWPIGVVAALLLSEAGLWYATRQCGATRVDVWLFSHRDHLPIPFLVVGLLARLLAPGGTGPIPHHWWPIGLGVSVLAAGESLRIWAVGIVGATTRSASVNAKRLVQEGPYAIIRNPIYAGNFFIVLGLACLTGSAMVVLMCAWYFIMVYGRIIRAEERFLGSAFGSTYEEFCRRVPRIFPRWPRPWAALRSPFSLRELRKEYQTIAGIACAALLLCAITFRPWEHGRASVGAPSIISPPTPPAPQDEETLRASRPPPPSPSVSPSAALPPKALAEPARTEGRLRRGDERATLVFRRRL